MTATTVAVFGQHELWAAFGLHTPAAYWTVTDSPDPVAVRRLVDGQRPAQVRPVEVREAVRQLTLRGHSNLAIADRLRVTDRTVNRYRQHLRALGQLPAPSPPAAAP